MLWTSYSIKNINKIFTELLETKLHILLCGPPGIGKSTLIYGYKHLYKIIELNASNERGISTVRNKIKDLTTHKQKLILLIDEADYMTIDAQSALRKLFELNTNTKLILTCNDKSKLIAPIRSRMYEIKLDMNLKFNIFRDKRFLIKNNSNFSNEMLALIYWNFDGDKRAILNFLQSNGSINFNKQKMLIEAFFKDKTIDFLKMFKRIGDFNVFKRIFIFSSFPYFFNTNINNIDEVRSVTDAFILSSNSFNKINNVSYKFISDLCVSDFIEELLACK